MIDSHCHLADDVFAAEHAEIVDRARAAGVTGALCILDADSQGELGRAGALQGLWPAIRFSAGIHPHRAGHYAGRIGAVVETVAAALDAVPHVRAIGEIGLDYHYDFSPPAVQLEVFRAQIRLARDRRLPVIIHAREADDDVVALLEEEGGGEVRGVFHCFTSDLAQARRVLSMGFFVSFAGIVTFPRASALREVARAVPLERLLVETDSPFLAPVPHRGTRNEPALVGRVAEALAAVQGAELAKVVAATDRNFEELFGG
jgi:TatD DNase family protein